MMKKADIKRAFTWLESGPVTLVTSSEDHQDDIMTISWHAVIDFIPHIVISTGPWNESYDKILHTKECVICVPGADLIDEAIKIGTTNGSSTDKFKENRLTRLSANKVNAPLIGECLACLECRLEDVVDDYGLLIFKGIQLWENSERKEKRCFHANGDGTFFADGELFYKREDMRKWVPEGSERL